MGAARRLSQPVPSLLGWLPGYAPIRPFLLDSLRAGGPPEQLARYRKCNCRLADTLFV